ncbi:MAG TPA: serine hydrolase domain-containing protein [Caulobacteraceae bacterium]|jgi:CubicO group peptidase (beta-lactamase class C family)|nr:serine hydrolase domain-containing protein [Caulobacteraceae bacterium]
MTDKTSTDVAARADALLAAFTPDRPGLAVLVARGGETLYERYLGGADLEHGVAVSAATRFHVASVSKQFTAFAAVQLSHAGKLDLEADIRTWLAEMPDFGQPITVSNLIHHTSGLRDQWELMMLSGTPLDGLIRQKAILAMAARQTALNFSPGTDFCYSNTGYSLLAEIVARASGVKFHQYLQDQVFAPLGMDDTVVYGNANQLLKRRAASYGLGADGAVRLMRLNYSNYGATSLQSTPRDLLKWSREILHPAVFDPALMASLEVPGRLRDGRVLTYAAGLALDPIGGRPAVWHSGADAGYRSMLISFPDQDASIVVLSNGAADTGKISADLADIFLGPAAPAAETVAADEAALTALAGYYVGDWGTSLDLKLEDGKLVTTLYGARAEARFLADGRFRLGPGSEPYARRADGAIETRSLGGVTTAWRPARRAAPSAGQLAALAGDYRCEELDVTYTLMPSEGGMLMSSLRSNPVALAAADEDHFEGGGVRLSVTRGAGGEAVGFTIATGRVRGLAFRRL